MGMGHNLQFPQIPGPGPPTVAPGRLYTFSDDTIGFVWLDLQQEHGGTVTSRCRYVRLDDDL